MKTQAQRADGEAGIKVEYSTPKNAPLGSRKTNGDEITELLGECRLSNGLPKNILNTAIRSVDESLVASAYTNAFNVDLSLADGKGKDPDKHALEDPEKATGKNCVESHVNIELKDVYKNGTCGSKISGGCYSGGGGEASVEGRGSGAWAGTLPRESASPDTEINVTLSDEVLNQLVAEEVLRHTNCNEGDVSISDIAIAASLKSGRIGELVAKKYLIKLVSDNHFSKISEAGELLIPTVQWMNEVAESGLPYDFSLVYANGAQRFCEVKTRKVISGDNCKQWFFSPSEFQCAAVNGSDYFCILLAIAVDDASGKISILKKYMVGNTGGLLHALLQQDAKLVIQVK